MSPAPSTLVLPDGRRLAWYEFGDPHGRPCLYTPGTPESGLAGGCYDEAARAAGIRWVSMDKPGYGHSDPHPGRRFTDWPADVAALADHLGLAEFAVAGESGGGAHALAVAHALPARTTLLALLAPMGPVTDPTALAGMRPTNVLVFRMAQHVPALLLLGSVVMQGSVRLRQRFPSLDARLDATAPEPDRLAMADPEYGLRRSAVADAFRLGPRGAAEELRLFVQPWGFELGDVRVPVHLWHGTADVNVPFPVAQATAARLPQVTTHFVQGEGHLVGFARRTEVMAVL